MRGGEGGPCRRWPVKRNAFLLLLFLFDKDNTSINTMRVLVSVTRSTYRHAHRIASVQPLKYSEGISHGISSNL